MAFDTEHEHSHGHHTGVPWLDVIVGVSAMFISVVSLVVSIQHGKTMEKMVDQNEKMVEASTMPFLTFFGNQLDPSSGKQRLSLDLLNGGVGPAVIDWFEVRYKGIAYSTSAALLKACCAAALPAPPHTKLDGVVYSNVSGTVLPPREKVEFLVVAPGEDLDLYTALNAARREMSLRACYCSVLDECWVTDFSQARPSRVTDCAHSAHGVSW